MADTPKRAAATALSDPCFTDTPPAPPAKRPKSDSPPNDPSEPVHSEKAFCPEKMHLISVLRNDLRAKCIVLHTRFEDTPEKESIVVLQKTAFPTTPATLRMGKVVRDVLGASDGDSTLVIADHDPGSIVADSTSSFPNWQAKSISSNDVYHRLLVSAGLEAVNDVDMTVIHPAEPHHFKRYMASRRRIIQETPDTYHSAVLPFLKIKPRDLGWVDNILNGTSEQDRVLFTDVDPKLGFTLVLDYRWNEQRIQEMHCLAITRDPELSCMRDLRYSHVPMLKRMLAEGRHQLVTKYNRDHTLGPLDEDQIIAYLHYPPTFYRLHIHFVHVDTGDDGGTRTGRAHLLDDVIRNLELDDAYYANRTMTIYLHENSPMLACFNQSVSSSVLTNGDQQLSVEEPTAQ